MTTKKHFKRRVRARAERTGESYTAALLAIRGQQQEQHMPNAAAPTEEVIASCSFCGKSSNEVARMVAGPGVFICNECVDLSATIIASSAAATEQELAQHQKQFSERPTDEILALLPALDRSATRVEADLARWVARLRSQGTGWERIAGAIGTTVDAARRRFEPTGPA